MKEKSFTTLTPEGFGGRFRSRIDYNKDPSVAHQQDHFLQQIPVRPTVAGTTKSTPKSGLKVFSDSPEFKRQPTGQSKKTGRTSGQGPQPASNERQNLLVGGSG
jgi:hypothetical protein